VGTGWSGDDPATEDKEGYASGSTTVGLTNNGHNTEQTTYATLGSGTVQKKDGTAHDIADVNNDLNNTQEITLDQQTGGLDATVTVDHRLLSEDGRKDIKNNFVDTYEHGEDIAKTVDTISQDENLGILNFGEALDNNAKGTQLKNDLLRNPENQHIIDGINSGDPELYAQAMKDLGHLAQEKFGLELSDINLYDGNKTDSLSLADTALVNVKGGTVVDESNQEYGNIFIDAGDGASKTDMTNTLGHEVLETQNLQGKDSGLTNGLFGSNSADTQEALANAFGNQFADRINQAAGGDLDNSGGANFTSNLKNSQAVAAGTQRADNVGAAKVEHRQLYVEEAQAILKYAPAYADKYGISEEQARKELAQQALRQVDQKWSEQDYIKENPRARVELAGIAREIGQVYESPTGRNIIDILADTESSTAFQAKDEVTFNNTNINAKEVSEIERGVIIDGSVESGFYARNATEHGEKPIDISLGDSASQAVDDTLQSFEQISDRISEDPIGLLKDTGQGLIDGAVDMFTHPEQLVLSDSRGSAEDRQLVAELQGDATAARNEAADSLMETVSDTLAVPGVGRIVKNAAGEVVEEAGEQAAKQALSKADDVVRMAGDTDGEMIGQNGPTYTAVNEPKADFYVGVDGPEDTLPATGYRYDRYKNDDGTDNKWGQQTLETQEGRATYIGFDKYDTGKDARNAFQVKGPEHVDSTNPKDSSWSDGRIRSEFDTLQLYENGKPQARVPDRLGDTQKGAPEPITEAYPEYGSGGAHQLHVDGKILQYDRSEVIPEK
jgi:filamentous hemagglutinin